MRVSRSAIGSVSADILSPVSPLAALSTAKTRRELLPARLGHTRDQALVGHLPETDAAEPKLPEHGAGPAAHVAASVPAHLELLRPPGLHDQCHLGHQCSLSFLAFSMISWAMCAGT